MTSSIRLDDLVTILRGVTPAHTSGDPSGSRFVGQAEVVGGGTTSPRFVDLSRARDDRNPVILADGDVVLAAMDPSHRSLLVDDELVGAVLGRECLALRITSSNSLIKPGYLAAWTRTPGFQALATANMSGSTMPRLSPKALGSFLIPVESVERQQKIESLVREFAAARAALARTQNVLQRLEAAELSEALKEMW